jgi:hypothetical protein
LVDTLDLGSSAFGRGGSSPLLGTINSSMVIFVKVIVVGLDLPPYFAQGFDALLCVRHIS